MTEARSGSGLYYPNRMALITIKALEEVMGKNGVNAILNMANLSELINNYPPDNLDRAFDFTDFTALNVALEEMFGPRSGRGLAFRAGRACFAHGLKNFGDLAGAGDLAFRILTLQTKLKAGLPALANIFNQVSDQETSVEEHETEYHYIIHKCPLCWKRKAKDGKPVGDLAIGVLREALNWVSAGREFQVVESECIATGGKVGRFVIPKEPIG